MTQALNINDVFWTNQGEGFHSGRRALFVRMPFCNYNCPWCDTEYNSFTKWQPATLQQFAQHEPCRFAVITGGEPMLNKHTPEVIGILKRLGFYIACETNGSAPILDGIDFATVSPKKYVGKGGTPYFLHPHANANASEFKYVVDDEFQFETLLRHDTKDGRRYSLSPEFNTKERQMQKILNWIQIYPEWVISLQTHKWIGLK